jgi:hypothetical protein
MTVVTKNALLSGLIAWATAILLSPVSMLASGELAGAPNELQPQSLNHAGIYALRRIEPDLTGLGVRFAVICRSITYIDG